MAVANLIGRLASLVPSVRRIRRMKLDPERSQERLLRKLLQAASKTEVGKRLSFERLATAKDVAGEYQRSVPLQSYEDIRNDVNRMRSGEEGILWPGRITDYAVSSGTASAGKIIPLSQSMLKLNTGFSLGVAVNHFSRTGDVSMWTGKLLSLPGRIEEDRHYPGTLIGEVSGLQARHAPALISRFFQAVPESVLFLDKWDAKLDAVVDMTIGQDVRVLAMVPTWGLVLFDKLVKRYNGTRRGTAKCVLDIWPNLRVFFSGGVALSSYRGLLEEQIGGPIHFVESYGASEGFFAFQEDAGDRDMLLHADNGVFFEFVPAEEVDSTNPTRLTLGEVETNARYALYVSNCSGLWSYAVGDVVRFTSRRPHKMVVAGRTSEMIDRFGEAVFGEEAKAALEEACRTSNSLFVDYHIAPKPPQAGELPSHQWLIEFERGPENVDFFAKAIDDYLQRVNRHYQIRREAGAFLAPEVISLPRGTYLRWLSETRQRVSVQSKVPRMSEERDIADRVLRFASEMASGA